MGNLKILSFGEKFKFFKDQQFNLRLHEHGLLRLIPLSVNKALFDVTDKVFFHSLINSKSYREMFFDHFSQKSDNKHGPFLLETIHEDDFNKIRSDHLREEVIQIVSSPKWSCPSISKQKLSDVKKLINHLINQTSEPYFLEKCLKFNSSSQEAVVYEHEWSHSLTSYYEYVIKDPSNKKVFLLIITYE